MATAAQNNSTQADQVSEAYAKALFDLTREQNVLPAASEELAQIVQIVDQNPGLDGIFAHPTIDRTERAATIEKLFRGRLTPAVLNFLLVLNRKGRLGRLRAIQRAFDRLVKEMRGEIDVEVHTARPLNAAQLESVANRVSRYIGKKAVMHPHTNPSLIGGLRIRVGDRLIDASVAAQLRKLARQLDTSGHDAVRTAADRLLVA